MLDKSQAMELALMLDAGMPSKEAIRYFYQDPAQAEAQHDRVLRSREVQDAVLKIQGKAWQKMTTDERVQLAISKHYNELAYFLYSRNYVDLVGAERQKADTCREALEAKLAGTSGKLGAIERFWDDVRAGRVKLTPDAPRSVSETVQ